MKKLYFQFYILICFFTLAGVVSKAQNCALLKATFSTFESRCAATGSIKINTSGGSGDYKYKVSGPVNTNYTSTDSITGLSAGTYIITITDVVSNCTLTIPNAIVGGSYQDPRFTLTGVDVSCDNGSNGSITVIGQLFGRGPFAYSIVAPSPMGVGTTNSTGIFPNLSAGNYSVRMTDSCGGIQTRAITIGNYTWSLNTYPFTKTGCDTASGFIKVIDSRGNISTFGAGIPGLTYGIVRSSGDTLWSTNPNFTFPLLGNNTFEVIAKDACGTIKKAGVTVSLAPSVGTTVNTYNYTCNTFDASVNNILNFIGAGYCLYDSNSVQIACNITGIFTRLPYGKYCIAAHDSCTDTTITRCFSAVPPPISVSGQIIISNKTCTDFTAAVTGQTGLTNPYYCLYDASNTLITCDSTGVFNMLPYGQYCITTRDGCRDTTFTTCFNVTRPTPIVYPIVPSYVTCTNFGLGITGDSLTGPQYCLYDSLGLLITCNGTGIFDSLAFGGYCVSIHDACTDTTIIKCFSVGAPAINNDLTYAIKNKTCNSFDAIVYGASLTGPQYCLYNSNDSLINCNKFGSFTNLPYGNYCVKARNLCPDTTFTICFNATPPIPDVDAAIGISNTNCNTFTATVTGQKNLTFPNYCIYDTANVLISCNTRGIFKNIPYGTYCIKITNTCYDTVITRCFTKIPPIASLLGSTKGSCSLGYAQFTLNMSSGTLPLNIKIYRTDGSLFSDSSYNSNPVTIDSIPAVAVGLFYKIIATDVCGNKDSVSLGAVASYFNHIPTVAAKCPGGSWPTGSGDIVSTISTNLGALTVRIIEKNGVAYAPALVPDLVSAAVYTFVDLGPGVYVMSASENSCSIIKYDTITITAYQFPNLTRSSAYQCDVNGFSVSAVASNGVGPFTYEIIGSVPSIPSILAGPQASPIININNGASYSLIRLRALDACGNATLGDASILPLVLNGIVSTDDCLFSPTTLSTDSIFNATYQWYKYNDAGTDSTFLGNGTSIFIPDVLPSDTGHYVCHLSVNTGCITRTYLFHLYGDCHFHILPVKLVSFTGHTVNDDNILNWQTADEVDIETFIVERRNENGSFIEIGRIAAKGNSSGSQQYYFPDNYPPTGKNYYRLRIIGKNNKTDYSKTIILNNSKKTIVSVYPNPATDKVTIDITVAKKHTYKIALFNSLSQQIKQQIFTTDGPGKVQLEKMPGMSKGMYILKITDEASNEIYSEKIIFY
jgi:hypothetical protein